MWLKSFNEGRSIEHIVVNFYLHYSDVIMSAMASQITGISIVYSTLCPGADQRKHQSSASLAFVRGIHRWPVNSPHKGPVTRKMFPLDDVIMSRKCLKLTIFFSSVNPGASLASSTPSDSWSWLRSSPSLASWCAMGACIVRMISRGSNTGCLSGAQHWWVRGQETLQC